MARAHQPGETGRSCPGGGGAEGGLAGGSSPQPGLTGLGGRGVLPRRWSVLKERMRGAVAPNSPGAPAWGDREVLPRR